MLSKISPKMIDGKIVTKISGSTAGAAPDGVITGIVISNPSPPILGFPGTPTVTIVGDGIGARATAIMTGSSAPYRLSGIRVDAGGLNYTWAAASVSLNGSSPFTMTAFIDGVASGPAGGSGSGTGVTVTGIRLSATDIPAVGGGGSNVTVYTPSVTLGAASITTSGSLIVNVIGAPPNSSIGVAVKDSAGAVKASSSFTAGANGTGTGTSSPGLSSAGTYSVVVTFDASNTYSSGNTITKTLTVTATSGVSYLPSLMISNTDITATTAKVTILTGPPGSIVNIHVAHATSGGNITFLDTAVTLNSIGTGVLNLSGLTSSQSYLIDFNFDTSYTYNPAYAKYLSTLITTL